MSCEEILSQIRDFPCRWIVWTGGEPTLQLTDEYLQVFRNAGFRQAIESNGSNRLSPLLDYTVISPKGHQRIEEIRSLHLRVNEVRLTVQKDDPIPASGLLPEATYYFLSPVFLKNAAETKANIDYCVQQVMQHPHWRLSLQMHKWIGIR
jgi:organic radical activating enzyme